MEMLGISGETIKVLTKGRQFTVSVLKSATTPNKISLVRIHVNICTTIYVLKKYRLSINSAVSENFC